jgi:predicted AAA+ superfamily ATPase
VRAFYHRRTVNVGYYRKSSKDGEIDVVVDYPGRRILVEVKYREQYSLGEKALIVTEASGAASALLITKRDNDYGQLQINPAVYRIPAYAFMYLLGHAEKNGNMN